MTHRTWRWAWGSVLVGMTVAGCGVGKAVTIANDAGTVVTVRSADEDFGEVAANGGAVVYADDCLEGPIVVTFEGGRVIELDESACPGQQLRIGDGTAEVVSEPEG